MAASVLELFRRFSGLPLGRRLFTRAVTRRAPYFASIRPLVEELDTGRCVVSIRNRRRVHNHTGTVHAIAMANMCELAAGLMTDVTIPPGMRWIPRGMTIEYRNKATTDLRAIATGTAPAETDRAADMPVAVDVLDLDGKVTVHAVITMYVSPKKR